MGEPREREPWLVLLPSMDEAQRRWLAGAMALQAGWGGVRHVQRLTGFSVNTVRRGVLEVQKGIPSRERERIRSPGGGGKPLRETRPGLLPALERILEENTAGDPMSRLRWTHKSTRTLAEELTREGHPVSHASVAHLLSELGYSLQANAKEKEGRSPPERDEQFRYINRQATRFQEEGNPVLSVDTKKKEKVGLFKNSGRTYRPSGEPVEVNVYDFPRLSKGTAVPYGVYDVDRNRGLVNVGTSNETGEFAAQSLRWWWRRYGRRWYPKATEWLVCADGGGGNGSNRRGWKYPLWEVTRELGIPVTVCHYPPGTSKWNKVEHRMFSHISMNWQGVPLESFETVVSLIAGTKTKTGLRVGARLDRAEYRKGVKISNELMEKVPLEPHTTNPQWNYTIRP
ncbi:MAG: ISAzo13 family transposase, partial [Thermoplasmata archaeon]